MRQFTTAKELLCPTLETYPASKIVSDLNNPDYKAICKNYKLSRIFFLNTLRNTEKLEARSYTSTAKIYFYDVTASRDRVTIWMGQVKLSSSY